MKPDYLQNIHIGTSGWFYNHWIHVLYPPDIPREQWLSVYSQKFDCVEINATFYRLPFENMVKGWYRKAPSNFIFVVKASRQITHLRKLVNIEQPLERFVQRVSLLNEKLGPLLYQLPPSIKKDLTLLENFLKKLPEDYLHAIEFRHASWEEDETFALLSRYNVAHCVVSRKRYPFVDVPTSSIVYFRLHGPEAMFSSSYDDAFLEEVATRLRKHAASGKTVYAFFNNDVEGHAVRNALTLKKFVEQI